MKKYQKTIQEKLQQYRDMDFDSPEQAEEWLGKAFDRIAREAISGEQTPAKKREFKVGDRVRVRDWDEMAEEYGIDEGGDIELPDGWFPKTKKHLCGRTATVIEIFPSGTMHLHQWSDERGDTYWFFLPESLEHVAEDHIADAGEMVDEAEEPPREIEEIKNVVANMNQPTTEFIQSNKINELIEAVNYLLNKQR